MGRFAPSPSGPLHFGSLLCALASYLDAKANGGRWLVRIEDIDPPREQAGASEQIIETLWAHGLIPDAEPVFQSERSHHYLHALKQLGKQGLTYRCNCTRKRLALSNGIYDGHCLRHPPPSDDASAIRINTQQCLARFGDPRFSDRIQGEQVSKLSDDGDFIVHRKDGLFAYQLAVVVDDIAQGISHVVRGCDLLDTTAQQLLLYSAMGSPAPQFAHIPVLVDTEGKKLSKQNHAPPIENQHARQNLAYALRLLGIASPSSHPQNIPSLLHWGVEHWRAKALHQLSSIHAPSPTM